MAQEPYFQLPLNLPHAATVARRIVYHLERMASLKRPELPVNERFELTMQAQDLIRILQPCLESEENPPDSECQKLVPKAAELARKIVDDIERYGLGEDRLGQAVRNFFECLSLGEEGARLSLRAGENPDSALRPQ